MCKSSAPLKHNRTCSWTLMADHTHLSSLSTISTDTGRTPGSSSESAYETSTFHTLFLLLLPTSLSVSKYPPIAATPNLNVLKQKFPQAYRNKSKNTRISLKKKKNLRLGGIIVPRISESDISKQHIDMVPKDLHHVSPWLPSYNKQGGRRIGIFWYWWPCFNLMCTSFIVNALIRVVNTSRHNL